MKRTDTAGLGEPMNLVLLSGVGQKMPFVIGVDARNSSARAHRLGDCISHFLKLAKDTLHRLFRANYGHSHMFVVRADAIVNVHEITNKLFALERSHRYLALVRTGKQSYMEGRSITAINKGSFLAEPKSISSAVTAFLEILKHASPSPCLEDENQETWGIAGCFSVRAGQKPPSPIRFKSLPIGPFSRRSGRSGQNQLIDPQDKEPLKMGTNASGETVDFRWGFCPAGGDVMDSVQIKRRIE
jgi:hypothetical protein